MSRPTRLRAALARTTAAAVLASGCVVVYPDGSAVGPSPCSDEVVVLNDNGAWSWFEDERAVIDSATGTLLVGSVASIGGSDGADRYGNVEVVAYDLATGRARRAVLHAHLQGDDHDSAALYVRPDGRYVAMYSRHDTDRLSRWRVSSVAGDAESWGPESTVEHPAPASYSNLYPATEEGRARLYALVRTDEWDPHILVSEDEGGTWRAGGRLLDGPGRPYVRYATDGAGRIHLIATEQHPADASTSIYHAVIADGRLQRSDGTVVDDSLFDDVASAPEQLTSVYLSAEGDRAWAIDVQVDSDGNPYAVFSVQAARSARSSHRPAVSSEGRYYYARFDGTAWRVHILARAGRGISHAEPFYTGLAALDPQDPSRVIISTDRDPTTGAPLVSRSDGRRHHELFEGVTTDGGATWAWRAVTADSAVDNIRPLVPSWDREHRALLWLRGRYTTYNDYDLDVVGIIGSACRVP